MSESVLITGGTGVVGQRLTQLLLQQGYRVSFLSRSSQSIPNVKVYEWDVKKGQLDPQALAGTDHIIHLAGAGVAEKRWTEQRKKEILDSRTLSTELLASHLRRAPQGIKSFIAASAIGYYGEDTGDQRLTETSPLGNGFLAQVVQAWEAAEDKVADLGIRTVKMRIGVVLSMAGGALPELARPIRFGVGAPLGSGRQYISWIHIDDLCRLFIQAMKEESWQGVYNAVAPTPVTNETFTRLTGEALKKPLILPRIPAFAIRLVFGELASTVLGGNYVLNKRIAEETSFQYFFSALPPALDNLLGS